MAHQVEPGRKLETTHTAFEPLKTRGGVAAFVSLFVFLCLCWVLLSNKWHADLFHLGQGLFSALLVSLLTYGVLFLGIRKDHRGQLVSRFVFSYPWYRLPFYVLWLFKEIILSNIAVSRMILTPKMPITPRMIRFESGLRGDLARTVMGNSITLTPGTVTLDIKNDVMIIHAIHLDLANDVLEYDMRDKVRRAFEPTQDYQADLDGHADDAPDPGPVAGSEGGGETDGTERAPDA